LVISDHTVFINLAPKTLKPRTNHVAHIIITHNSIPTFAEIQWFFIASLIAANGQIAFATSFAQCANDKRATANIRGILNNLFMNFFQFLK